MLNNKLLFLNKMFEKCHIVYRRYLVPNNLITIFKGNS